MKKWNKFMVVFLSAIMLFVNLSTPVFAEKNKSSNKDELVDVTVYEDSENIIIAQVPKSKEKEFLKDLKNKDYKNATIQNHLNNINKNTTEINSTNNMVYARSSNPDYVKYFGRSNVIATIDAMDKQWNWQHYLSNPFTDAAIGRIVYLVTGNSVIGWGAAVTTWSAAQLSNRHEQWWKDTFIMIARGQARGAKLSVTYNKTSSYPAAWIILSRY
ncbi:MAG: hypothetical protein ACQER2_04465 [Bacillota bacterium]